MKLWVKTSDFIFDNLLYIYLVNGKFH